MRIKLDHHRLAAELAKSRLSQNAWAMRLGLDPSHLSKLLTGKRPYPGDDTRKKLLDGLRVSFDEIFSYQPATAQTPTDQSGSPKEDSLSQTGGKDAAPEGPARHRFLFLEWEHRQVSIWTPRLSGISGLSGKSRFSPGSRCHQQGGLSNMLQHFRFASRRLARKPAAALLLLAVLSLGIASTAALFSVVEQVLLRPLPYPHSERLMHVWLTYPRWKDHPFLGKEWNRVGLSYPEYHRWQENPGGFEAVAACGPSMESVLANKIPSSAAVCHATASLFSILGAKAALGRTFGPGEDGPGAPNLAVLSHGFWQRKLGGDPDVLQKVVRLGETPYTVIGVLPAGFRFRSQLAGGTGMDLYVPLGSGGRELDDEGHHFVEALGRLAPSVTQSAAKDASEPVIGGNSSWPKGIRVVPRLEEEVVQARDPLLLLLGAVCLLFLVACANVAVLQLADLLSRRNELRTRQALGASRTQLIGQLTAENALVGLVAAILSVPLAIALVQVLVWLAPPHLLLGDSESLDFSVFLVAVPLGVLAGLLSGAVPALLGAKTSLYAKRAPRRLSAQRFVVAAELALSLVLLVGAGLLGSSLAHLMNVDPGFRPQDIAVVPLSLPAERYGTEDALRVFYDQASGAMRGLPGVSSVTAINAAPFSGRGGSSSFEIVGREAGEHHTEADRRNVLPGYFESMGIPLIAGRTFTSEDRKDAPPVTIMSRQAAETFWLGESPIGERIVRDNITFEIVGVVGDVLQSDLSAEKGPTYYFALDQQPVWSLMLVIKGAPPLETVQQALWQIDGALPIDSMTRLTTLLESSLRDETFRAAVVSAFGVLALFLTSIGVFGVAARSVRNRSHEMALRVALGAPRTTLLAGIVKDQIPSLVIGTVAGVALAAVMSRLISSFLFTASPADPRVYLLSALVVLLLATTASLLAARPLTRLQPREALRIE